MSIAGLVRELPQIKVKKIDLEKALSLLAAIAVLVFVAAVAFAGPGHI